MGFVSMFGKSMMKNAYLPKISILLLFGSEILALLYRDDSIQILLIFSQFLMFGTETKLEGFVWSHQGKVFCFAPPPPTKFQFSFILCFQNDLPWGGYGVSLELHNAPQVTCIFKSNPRLRIFVIFHQLLINKI